MSDDDAAARRAARRAAARAHHPDLGGDPGAFIDALAELARPTPDAPRYDVRPSSRLRRTSRALRRTVRTVRGQLPRGVPGSTRYHQI